MDIYQTCLDEVALEGLDGITISALWLRLNNREEKISVKLSATLKEILWKFLLQHSSIEFFQIAANRSDPVIFNRYLGINVASGKHIAIAPDELDVMENIYFVKPITNKPDIKGSCVEFETRLNITNQLKEDNLSLFAAIERYGEQRLVIVASQSMREGVLRGAGISSQTIESLTDIEYCILERIGRSRWQGEIQTVLNNYVFKQLKSAHIHYMMKALFQKGLVTKQPYSYVRDDKNGKVYQQILLHLPHFRTDARSVADIRAETICEILKQSETRAMSCFDLRQILAVEGKTFRKLTAKMVASGYVKVISLSTAKNSDKIMTLIKTPAEKHDEELLDDIDDSADVDGESTGLVAELPLTLQGYRHIFSTGENGCSQGNLNRKLRGYGSLEARHLCRKVEKAKIVKIIMIDHGKQRTQKYIADKFANNSLHTKEFFEEKKKMQKILETSDCTLPALDGGDTTNLSMEELNDTRLLAAADNHVGTSFDMDSSINPAHERDTVEAPTDITASQNGSEMIVDHEQDSVAKKSKWDTHQTTRKMKRTNTILKYINEQKVVEGFFALQKVLQAEEREEGLTTKVCKKTVKRLVQKLNKDSLIKHFTVPITSNDCTIDVNFVMSLDCDSLRLKTAIEQAQFRKYSEDSKKIAAEQADAIDLISPAPTLSNSLHSAMNLTDIVKIEDCKPSSKIQYGYQPKFLRNQIVHEYLWYLAYGHPANGEENLEMLDYDNVKEYSLERNWKRFLPPAPRHPDFGPGWLQVGDAAVLLPLSILCQFHQYSYKIDGLEQYLMDPTQKHTLVRHLPLKMRGLIFHKRKYLLSLIQVIENLCFMGLITFNKQKKHVNIRTRKEFEMIYVHKITSILDTRKSDKGYSEISEGLDYEKLSFHLDKFTDVEQYWMKLRDISLMTPLGVRVNDEADVEAGTRHTVKLKLFVADHVTRDRFEPVDDGSIPGDHRGAAGLDSSMFAHLYRNWFRTMKVSRTFEPSLTPKKLDQNDHEKPRRLPKLVPTVLTLTEEVVKKPRKRTRLVDGLAGRPSSKKRTSSHMVVVLPKKPRNDLNSSSTLLDDDTDDHTNEQDDNYEIVSESNVGRNERVKGGKGRKRTADSDSPFALPKKRMRKKKESLNASAKPKERYIDALDMKARSFMNGRLRVSFSPAEDEILLVCKIASSIISNHVTVKKRVEAHNVVPGLAIRNLLWKYCEEGKDKTSIACLRRIRRLMKHRNASIFHDVNVTELTADVDVMNELFHDFEDTAVLEDSQKVEELFQNVFNEVLQRFKNTSPTHDIVLPDTVEELYQKYQVNIFSASKKPPEGRIVSTVTTTKDIVLATIENLIYAILSLNEDEFSQYQAYKIFENYPSEFITEVWQHVKSTGIICKKPDICLNRQRFLPFAVPIFHLSKSHFQYLQTGPMWKVFSELSTCMKTLRKKQTIVCDMNTTSGPVIAMNVMYLNQNTGLTITQEQESTERGTGKSIEAPKKSRDPANTSSAPDGDDSDDDVTQKADVSDRELFKLYRIKRFTGRQLVLHHAKTLCPVHLHSDQDADDCQSVLDDVQATVQSLVSIKCPANDSVNSIEEEIQTKIPQIINQQQGLENEILAILSALREAGPIGVPLIDLKQILSKNHFLSSSFISVIINVLKENDIIYILGVWHERAVLKPYVEHWVVAGTVFKGDRKYLRDQIRKELSVTTSRRKAISSQSWKRDEVVYDVFKNNTPIDEDVQSLQRLAASFCSQNQQSNTDDTMLLPPNDPKTSSEIYCVLSDSSNYESVRFVCRPWHNVSGEVNYRTAKLLITGVFVHILWHPGVTMRALNDRFMSVMQRIALIELLEKLVMCKCITRHKIPKHKPWRLFSSIEDDLSSVTSPDDDFFRATTDGMWRMTRLCLELDQLQIKRHSDIFLYPEADA